MLTLFAIPDSGTTITAVGTQVTAYVAEFLPAIYLSVAMVVVVGTILFVTRKVSGGARAILGGKRRGRGRRR